MKRPSKSSDSNSLVALGPNLIGLFQNTVSTLTTIEQSKHQAALTEATTLEQFDSYNRQNGVYVAPSDIPITEHEQLARASLDTQFQKVQASHIEQYGNYQINELQQLADNQYIGTKIEVRSLDKNIHPIHSCWQDSASQDYYFGDNYSQSKKGTIVKIDLLRNYIIIKPSFSYRLISRSIELFLIEVLDPQSILPIVEIHTLS